MFRSRNQLARDPSRTSRADFRFGLCSRRFVRPRREARICGLTLTIMLCARRCSPRALDLSAPGAEQLLRRSVVVENTSYRAIAIVGAGAILPDAPNVPAFWENIDRKSV